MKSKELKRIEAAERQERYNALTLHEKVELAITRGGKRELKRLLKQLRALEGEAA